MKLLSMSNATKILLTTLFVLSNLTTLLGQRLLQPIRSFSLIATPVLLERQSSINDLEVISVEHSDTLNVNQMAQFTGYLKNTSDIRFKAAINLNFNINQLEGFDFDNTENFLECNVDNTIQLPQTVIQPGDSIQFSHSINIDPNKIDPNTTGIVIIWPEFRLSPDEDIETNYLLGQFFATSLSLGGHGSGTGKTVHNNNISHKINSFSINSINVLQNHLTENNYKSAEFILTTIDGKVILQQCQIPKLNIVNNVMLQNNSKIAVLSVVAIKPNVIPKIITIKLHQSTF